MIELEQIITSLQEANEQRKRTSYYFLNDLIQRRGGEDLLVKVDSLQSRPTFFVSKPGLSPQPVFVEYYHDDSDDDTYSVDAYDEDVIYCFYIDTDSGVKVNVLYCSNMNSLPSVRNEYVFYRRSNTGDERVELLPNRSTYCRRLDLSVNSPNS